ITDRFRKWATHEANIWLTVAGLLFIVLMAWLFNTKIGPLASDAAGLSSSKNQVVLVDGSGRPYPDVMSIQSGESIVIGYRAFGLISCTPSWSSQKGTGLTPKTYGPIYQSTSWSVTCTENRSKKQTTDSLQVNVANQSSGFSVTNPRAGDTWEMGKTYSISWTPAGTAQGSVSITVAPKPPACVSAPNPCMVKQIAPYLITQNASDNGEYSWRIPSNLNSHYWGKQQITVTRNGTGKIASSGEFSIVVAGSKPPESPSKVLQVLSPNGGENWVAGSKHVISWNPGPSGSTFKIQLRSSSCTDQYCLQVMDRLYTIATGVKATSYSWTVGQTQSVNLNSGRYYVVVTVENGDGGSDTSDAAFTIGAS